MALLGREQVGVRQIGTVVSIPTDPRARLMYYLNCLCTLCDIPGDHNINRLRDYQRYYLLTDPEVAALTALCIQLSPDELEGKIIFQNDELCGDSNNEFYELSAVSTHLLLTDSIVIGGERTQVKKIMAYKQNWILQNYLIPIKVILDAIKSVEQDRQRQVELEKQRQQRERQQELENQRQQRERQRELENQRQQRERQQELENQRQQRERQQERQRQYERQELERRLRELEQREQNLEYARRQYERAENSSCCTIL